MLSWIYIYICILTKFNVIEVIFFRKEYLEKWINNGYIYRKKLFKMFISTTYSKIIVIERDNCFLNNY